VLYVLRTSDFFSVRPAKPPQNTALFDDNKTDSLKHYFVAFAMFMHDKNGAFGLPAAQYCSSAIHIPKYMPSLTSFTDGAYYALLTAKFMLDLPLANF
jgi:hypothetical protein